MEKGECNSQEGEKVEKEHEEEEEAVDCEERKKVEGEKIGLSFPYSCVERKARRVRPSDPPTGHHSGHGGEKKGRRLSKTKTDAFSLLWFLALFGKRGGKEWHDLNELAGQSGN